MGLFFYDILFESEIDKKHVDIVGIEQETVVSIMLDFVRDYLISIVPSNKTIIVDRTRISNYCLTFCGFISMIDIMIIIPTEVNPNRNNNITICIDLNGGSPGDYTFCKSLLANLTKFVQKLPSNKSFNEAISQIQKLNQI